MSGEHHGGAATRMHDASCRLSCFVRLPGAGRPVGVPSVMHSAGQCGLISRGCGRSTRRTPGGAAVACVEPVTDAQCSCACCPTSTQSPGGVGVAAARRRASVPAARRRAGRTDPAESRRQPSRGHGAMSSATPSSAVEDKTSWPTACLCDLTATTHSRTFQAMAPYLQQTCSLSAPPSGLFSARSCARRASRALRCAD